MDPKTERETNSETKTRRGKEGERKTNWWTNRSQLSRQEPETLTNSESQKLHLGANIPSWQFCKAQCRWSTETAVHLERSHLSGTALLSFLSPKWNNPSWPSQNLYHFGCELFYSAKILFLFSFLFMRIPHWYCRLVICWVQIKK